MLGQNGSSRLDTVLKMLLIAFVSLLAFSSGVYFGKQMSDSEYQLKALEKDFNDNDKVADVDDAKTEEAANPSQDAMIDEQVTALSDKYMKTDGDTDGDAAGARDVASVNEKSAQPTQKAATTEKAPVKTSQVNLNDVKKVAQRVLNNEPPTVPEKIVKSRKPASLPRVTSPTAVAEYTVQVASYPDEKQAQSRAAELVQKGFPAYPVEANVKGKTWYRVSVGSFKTAKDATDYKTQLMKQANLSSALVQKIDR